MDELTEMQKLKEALDENEIDWETCDSQPEDPWQFEGVRFKIGKEKYDVVCGEYSMGGKSGKLELCNYRKKRDPVRKGYLTAGDVLRRTGIIKEGKLGTGY